MGLSISYKIIVEKHGGKLECVSNPNQGGNQQEQSRFEHLSNELQGDRKQQLYLYLLQRLQFPDRSRSVVLANRHNLPMIAFFDLGTNLGFIECIAALGKFFFAISGLSDCHRDSPRLDG